MECPLKSAAYSQLYVTVLPGMWILFKSAITHHFPQLKPLYAAAAAAAAEVDTQLLLCFAVEHIHILIVLKK